MSPIPFNITKVELENFTDPISSASYSWAESIKNVIVDKKTKTIEEEWNTWDILEVSGYSRKSHIMDRSLPVKSVPKSSLRSLSSNSLFSENPKISSQKEMMTH